MSDEYGIADGEYERLRAEFFPRTSFNQESALDPGTPVSVLRIGALHRSAGVVVGTMGKVPHLVNVKLDDGDNGWFDRRRIQIRGEEA